MSLDELLAAALTPHGNSADRAYRDRAIAELIAAHPDEARTRLLDALRRDPNGLQAPAILDLLPHFGGAETVPVIAAALGSPDEMVAQYAGRALGRHPDPSAVTALRAALASPAPSVVAAAADGARLRRTRELCDSLRARADVSEAIARYHVINALLSCGCVAADERRTLAAAETDPDIAALLADNSL